MGPGMWRDEWPGVVVVFGLWMGIVFLAGYLVRGCG